MIPVAEITTSAGIVLNDEDHFRWDLQELYQWINQAASAVVVIRPQAGAVTEIIELAEGALQAIPEDGLELLDVIANGDGYPVDRTSRHDLDAQAPGWRAGKKKGRVRHFTFDDRQPTVFYVYPPVVAGTQVEVAYARPPAKISAETDTLGLDRSYLPAVVSYVLHRALAKDSEYADGQMSAMHYQAFQNALGIQTQSAASVSPNRNEP